MARLVTKPGLMESYAALCHFKFQNSCWLPLSAWALVATSRFFPLRLGMKRVMGKGYLQMAQLRPLGLDR